MARTKNPMIRDIQCKGIFYYQPKMSKCPHAKKIEL